MPFLGPGSDIAMRRNPATGRLDFDWGPDGNPRYSDDNVHRVLSLLVEHRPSSGRFGEPGSPGWVWDRTGRRGSLLYTVRNVRRSTPSEVEAYVIEALQKAVDEGWIRNPTAKAFLSPPGSARVEVSWQNPSGTPASLKLLLPR